MNHFDYRNGVLHAEAVNLIDLADEVGTPFYCYSTATLERHYRVFSDAFAGENALVCYALKANSNQSVLRTLAKLGAGADVVSGGELKRALAAGIPPAKDPVLRRRQDRGRDARGAGPPTSSASTSNPSRSSNRCRGLRPRPAAPRASRFASIPTSTPAPTPRSPPASPRTSSAFPSRARATSTPSAAKLPGIEVTGIDVHIGSQITDLEPFDDAFRAAGRIRRRRCAPTATRSRTSISAAGSAFPITTDNAPPPTPAAYAAIVKRVTHVSAAR